MGQGTVIFPGPPKRNPPPDSYMSAWCTASLLRLWWAMPDILIKNTTYTIKCVVPLLVPRRVESGETQTRECIADVHGNHRLPSHRPRVPEFQPRSASPSKCSLPANCFLCKYSQFMAVAVLEGGRPGGEQKRETPSHHVPSFMSSSYEFTNSLRDKWSLMATHGTGQGFSPSLVNVIYLFIY